MLTIDGSHLEGGGQILRMAVALAAVDGRAVEINRIRAGRSRPGLAAQHVTAVQVVANACGARCRGLAVGSERIIFLPSELHTADSSLNVGTAGSVSLIIQAWLPVALRVGGSITILGGTEVEHSPSVDYLNHVFLPLLQTAGGSITMAIRHRGYYPRGGGEVHVMVRPSSLRPITIEESESPPMGICSASSNLPDHVTERQAAAARERLRLILKVDSPVVLDRRTDASTGSSCTVWYGARGGTALGKRGLPAEIVGRNAANEVIASSSSGGLVDGHLADQLLIYLAQYGGWYTTGSFSSHLKTMAWLLEKFGYAIDIRSNRIIEVSG